MSRRVLILDLKDDPELIARYEAHHRRGAVPQAVVRSIREAGIEEMEIYRSGNRLVMMLDTAEGFDPETQSAADAPNPDVLAWEELMDRFQQPLPWAPAGTKWVEADRIFALSEQSGAQRRTGDSQPGTF
jgi:L-rhamnose mutarotase